MNDFQTLATVIQELNAEEATFEYGVKMWPEMTEIDLCLARLEADNLIEKRLEKYKTAFVNPDFFDNLREYLQNKYREKLAAWMVENGTK